MRKNAFESLRRGWMQMSPRQWQDFLAVSGDLSQKQRRALVQEMSNGSSFEKAQDQEAWLRRCMGSLAGLSAWEMKNWWKTVERTHQPAMIAMEQGLGFDGQDPAFVKQTLRVMAGSFPGPCFSAWSRVEESLRKDTLDLVILGLLRSVHPFMSEPWLPEIVARGQEMEPSQRRRLAVVLFSYVEDEHEEQGKTAFPVVEELLDIFAPPHSQVLSTMQTYVSDPCGLLPCRLSAEEAFRIDQQTQPARQPSRAPRI